MRTKRDHRMMHRTNLTLSQLEKVSREPATHEFPAGGYFKPVRHIDLANSMLHEFTLAQWRVKQSFIWINDRPSPGTRCVINFIREDGMFLAAYNSFVQDKALTFFVGYQQNHGGLVSVGHVKFKHTPNFELDESVYQMTRRLRLEGVEFESRRKEWEGRRLEQTDSDRILMEAGRQRLVAHSRVFSVHQLYCLGEPTVWNMLDCFSQVNMQTPPLLQLESADRFREMIDNV